MQPKKYITHSFIRLTLVDKTTWDYKDIIFWLYNTPISQKWLEHFAKLKNGNNDFREKSFKLAISLTDIELVSQLNQCIDKINTFYDNKLNNVDSINDSTLNYLHEQYEVYGQRVTEFLEQDYWKSAYKKIPYDDPRTKVFPGITFNEDMHYSFIKLNELVHRAELQEDTIKIDTGGIGGIITTSLNPRIDFDLTDDDWLNSVRYTKFGDLCLGYNTLGKNLGHVVRDLDFDAVNRNAIVPQKTWSNELYIDLLHEGSDPYQVREYKRLWNRLKITEKLGYQFGNYIQNREGYIKIGEIHSDLYEDYITKRNGIAIDFTKYNTMYDIEIISKRQFYLKERYPVWKKPVKQVGKTIDRIDNYSNIITWVLNDICTYNCRYCPPLLHNGKNHKYDWNHLNPFLDKLFALYGKEKPIIFSLSGGEPTLSPFFPELVKTIYANGGYTGITTNLARSDRYIKENFKYLIYACCSFHPAMEFPNNTSDFFVEKIKVVQTVTFATVRVMMDPLYWNETIEFINKLKTETKAKIELVMIEEQYGSSKNKLAEIPYTREQLDYINNFKTVENTTQPKEIKSTNPYYKNFSKASMVTFEDDSTTSLFTPQEYINNGQTTFFDYMCKIGNESLFIHQSGRIRRGNCTVGGWVGHLDNWQDINWDDLQRPIRCNVLKCHCGADVQVTKWRN